MSLVKIRQSGGSNIVSLPTSIVKTLGLGVGSKLDLTIRDNSILLTPVEAETSLEDLLAGSPKSAFAMTLEDREWIDAKPVGNEIL